MCDRNMVMVCSEIISADAMALARCLCCSAYLSSRQKKPGGVLAALGLQKTPHQGRGVAPKFDNAGRKRQRRQVDLASFVVNEFAISSGLVLRE